MVQFPIQKFVIFNVITNSILVEKLGKLERAKNYVYKNLSNVDSQDSICFGIYQVAYE